MPKSHEELHKRSVWNKGHVIVTFDASTWRHDQYGNVMRYEDYGNRDSKYGWEIDHITPLSLGGSNDLANLRPLSWQVNAKLGGLLSG